MKANLWSQLLLLQITNDKQTASKQQNGASHEADDGWRP
jgi:hypothetical protein